MIPPLDPFALRFDSIEIDPARAPSPEAIARAFEIAAPPELPGFYLLDDAGGRFVVDRDMGVVSLKDEALLERERGAVHVARLRVIEPSGARYEIEMPLRLTGRVPQMVGAEAFADMAGVGAEAVAVPRVAWSEFAAARGAAVAARLGGEAVAFGALLVPAPPRVVAAGAVLALAHAPPAPSSARAVWPV